MDMRWVGWISGRGEGALPFKDGGREWVVERKERIRLIFNFILKKEERRKKTEKGREGRGGTIPTTFCTKDYYTEPVSVL